jgi:8-oxo-dGTP pyrophosphatase MutT (NUDIX family)
MALVVRAGLIVAIKPYRQSIQVLLIRRGIWNHDQQRPQKFPGEWVFPGGTREHIDSSLRATAQREFREETGYRGRFWNVKQFRTGIQESPGRTFFIEFFTARIDQTKPFSPHPEEVLELAWMTPRTALRIATSKKFNQQQQLLIRKHGLNNPKYGKYAIANRQHALQNIITMRQLVAKVTQLKKSYC